MKKLLGNTMLFLAAAGFTLSSCESTKRMSNQDKARCRRSNRWCCDWWHHWQQCWQERQYCTWRYYRRCYWCGAAGGIIGNKMDKQAQKIKTEIPGAKVERVAEGINVTFDENNPDGSKAGVYFATNKYNINDNSKLALDKLVKISMSIPKQISSLKDIPMMWVKTITT